VASNMRGEIRTRLEISWDGSSADKKARRKTVFPKLKSRIKDETLFLFKKKLEETLTVSIHLQVRKEVICVGLTEVIAIQVEGREANCCPKHNLPINLPE
jgi:hypothetical protein